MLKNTDKKNILGTLTPNSFSGVWDAILAIENLSYFPPIVLATGSVEDATSITLPSNIREGNTIIIYTSAEGNVDISITSPTNYTRLQGSQYTTYEGASHSAIYYKSADGTEGGSTVTINGTILNNEIISYIILDKGSPNTVGTNKYGSGSTATVGDIYPERGSLILLATSYSNNSPTNPTVSLGFDTLIDNTNNSGGQESFIWSRVSDGSPITNTIINWGVAAVNTNNMFSFDRGYINEKKSATLVSTSTGGVNTVTLGTVNKNNLIVLFLVQDNGTNTIVGPSGFTNYVTYDAGNKPASTIAYKIANGTETTLTGTWDNCISAVVDGNIEGIGDISFTNASGGDVTVPSIYLQTPSLVLLNSINNNNSAVVSSPPVGWDLQASYSGGTKANALYSKSYTSAQSTGTVSLTWSTSSNQRTGILVAFNK